MHEKLGSKREKLRVILDSNALFVPIKFKIDIFEGLKTLLSRNFELVVLSPVKRELEKILEKGSPKKRKEAFHALKMAERCKLVETEKEGSPDDIIVEMAREWRCPVFTNDKKLRKRLKDIRVPVIYVRQKSRLEIDGRI
ncbi:MAG: DNA-binding protein [Nitrososphaerota archaeon]|nr:DNA-binding protein [Candidatus Bathyarchaeota archaeon]MDW8023835.1 DNA-binding protein [Nitrososphaerota archaeon]